MTNEQNDIFTTWEMNYPKANAINYAFLNELNRIFDDLEENEEQRGILVRSMKSSFCAGLDLAELMTYNRQQMQDFMLYFCESFLKVFSCPKPVVIELNGHAIAGGLVFSYQSDLTYGIEKPVKLGLLESKLGIGLPGAVLQTLTLRIRAEYLMKVAFEAALFDMQQAHKMGLVHEVYAEEVLHQKCKEKLQKLCQIAPKAYAQIKNTHRGPLRDTILFQMDKSLDSWLSTWFSDEAQKRVQAQIDSIGKK